MMTMWTVMFGDDPLKPKKKGSTSARVRVFQSRQTAYSFKDFCKGNGVYADVVYHPYADVGSTYH